MGYGYYAEDPKAVRNGALGEEAGGEGCYLSFGNSY